MFEGSPVGDLDLLEEVVRVEVDLGVLATGLVAVDQLLDLRVGRPADGLRGTRRRYSGVSMGQDMTRGAES